MVRTCSSRKYRAGVLSSSALGRPCPPPQATRTGEAAGRHGLSPGRVSQKRAQFHADWLRFHGELT